VIVLALAHPLPPSQLEQLSALAGEHVSRVYHEPVALDETIPFALQVRELVGRLPVTAAEWQSERIVLVPPSLASITAILLAHLHGRMGYFPAIIRLRPVARAGARVFEMAEILDLNSEREEGRRCR